MLNGIGQGQVQVAENVVSDGGFAFVRNILDQDQRCCVRDNSVVSQSEGVVKQLGAANGRDDRVVAYQLFGQQLPVVLVVVDAEVAAELEVGQDPAVGRHRTDQFDAWIARRQPHQRRPAQVALDRLTVGQRHGYPPDGPAGGSDVATTLRPGSGGGGLVEGRTRQQRRSRGYEGLLVQ